MNFLRKTNRWFCYFAEVTNIILFWWMKLIAAILTLPNKKMFYWTLWEELSQSHKTESSIQPCKPDKPRSQPGPLSFTIGSEE